MLESPLRQFYGRQPVLIDHYGISVSQMFFKQICFRNHLTFSTASVVLTDLCATFAAGHVYPSGALLSLSVLQEFLFNQTLVLPIVVFLCISLFLYTKERIWSKCQGDSLPSPCKITGR